MSTRRNTCWKRSVLGCLLGLGRGTGRTYGKTRPSTSEYVLRSTRSRPRDWLFPLLRRAKRVHTRRPFCTNCAPSSNENVALWRSPDYVFSRLFVHAFFALFISLSFLNLGHSVRDLQYRVFAIFWLAVLPAIVMTQIEPMFMFNRRTFIREASSRIYSPYVFAIAQLIGEIPYSILCAVVYWVLMVFPMHFGQGATGLNGVGFDLLIVIFMELFGVSIGQLIAALSPSIHIAVLFNPFIGIVLAMFCGVAIPYPSMAKFWRDWLYQLVPYTRTLSAMLSTELHGLVIRCASDEFNVFNPPTNQTCQDWAGDFVSAFGGYLDNPTATAACRYCQYAVGDEFFTPLNIRFDTRWRDAFILFAYFVFNVVATIIASRFLRYARR